MPRSTGVVAGRRRGKRILKRAKGFVLSRSKQIRTAMPAVLRAEASGFGDRHRKRRLMRQLWAVRLSAALRARGLKYSSFIHGLKKANIALDRRVLAALANEEPGVFDGVVAKVKQALAV